MKMDDTFVLDRYSYELTRKEQLNAALTLPVALLTAIGTAALAMLRTFTFQEEPVTAIFFTLLIASGIALAATVGFMLWTYYKQDYAYMPLLRDLDEWAKEDHEWRSYAEANDADLSNEPDFAHQLRSRIIEAADANTRRNDDRSKWLHYARMALVAAFVSTALAAIPYARDQVRAQHVEQLNKAAAGAAQAGEPAASPRSVPGK